MTVENIETKNELYLLIQDKQTKQEFEDNILSLQHEFGDLIDEDAAAFLIVDKLGYNTANVVRLADVHPGQEATVQGIITTIQPIRSFTRKNGREGKVANVLISDETGSLPVVLWNDDANRVEHGEFQQDMKIKIINGYTKQGIHGVELHVGRWSSVSIELKDASDEKIVNHTQHDIKSSDSNKKVKGTILSISSTNVFLKKDETYGFVCKVYVKTTRGIELITVWDNQVKTLQDFNQGDTVEFAYLDVKMNNNEKEYHANGKAVITLC